MTIKYVSYSIILSVFMMNFMFTIMRRKNIIWFSVLIMTCWMLAWGTIGGPDYEIYKNSFNFITLEGIAKGDIAYNTISYIVKELFNLSYIGFRIIIYGFGYFFLGRYLWKNTVNPNNCLLIYALLLLPVDIVQTRNFVGMVFFIYSVHLFLNQKYIKSFLSLVVASLFHTLFLGYFLIYFIYHTFRKQRNIRFIESIIIIFIITLVLQILQDTFSSAFFNLVEMFFLSDRLGYFTTRTRFGHWLYWVYQFYTLYMFYLFKSKDINSSNELLVNYKNLFYFNFLLSIFFPLFLFNNNFLRLFRNVFVLNYNYFSNRLHFNEKSILNEIVVFLYLIFSWFVFSASSNTIAPIFDNSLFF